jgi:hypothetical protein
MFVINQRDVAGVNETVLAASKILKGPTNVVKQDGPRSAGDSTNAAADWFLKYL